VDGCGQVYNRMKRLCIISAYDVGSMVKKGFSLCLFTLNSVLFLGSIISTAPCGKTTHTMNGPNQRVFSFPAKIWSLELYSRTLSPGAKFFRVMIWSWKSLVLLLVIWAFSYASFRISSNSKIWSFLSSPALLKSKLSCLMAQRAWCSNSTGRWQAFSNMIL